LKKFDIECKVSLKNKQHSVEVQRSYFGTVKIGVDPDGVRVVDFDVDSVEWIVDVDFDVGCVIWVDGGDCDDECFEWIGDVGFDVGCVVDDNATTKYTRILLNIWFPWLI